MKVMSWSYNAIEISWCYLGCWIWTLYGETLGGALKRKNALIGAVRRPHPIIRSGYCLDSPKILRTLILSYPNQENVPEELTLLRHSHRLICREAGILLKIPCFGWILTTLGRVFPVNRGPRRFQRASAWFSAPAVPSPNIRTRLNMFLYDDTYHFASRSLTCQHIFSFVTDATTEGSESATTTVTTSALWSMMMM